MEGLERVEGTKGGTLDTHGGGSLWMATERKETGTG